MVVFFFFFPFYILSCFPASPHWAHRPKPELDAVMWCRILHIWAALQGLSQIQSNEGREMQSWEGREGVYLRSGDEKETSLGRDELLY